MKNFGTHITSWISMLLLLVGCILYPSWLKNGYLDNLYLIISVFIVCYGGFITNLIWYILFLKNNK